jgi:hypothetical protein
MEKIPGFKLTIDITAMLGAVYLYSRKWNSVVKGV